MEKEPLIDPIPVEVLKSELTPARKLRDTNKGHNEIYVVDWRNAPNTLREIGRLRELTFRTAGGGAGVACDIDDMDLMEKPYQQIIVWDPDAEAIIGGYCYILGPDITFDENGHARTAVGHMFHMSKKYIEEYMPHTMELRRAFVVPDYQSSKAGAKALFALDNLWDGIAAVMLQHPDIMYFVGKMSFYKNFPTPARDLLLYFIRKHFPDPDNLLTPFDPVEIETNPAVLDLILKDDDFKDDYRNLKEALKKLGTGIPPMINTYINASPTMRTFGTGIFREFGDVYDTCIMIAVDEMSDDKRVRHIDSFIRETAVKLLNRYPWLSGGSQSDLELRIADHWRLRRLRRVEARNRRIFSKKKQKGRKG